MKFIRVLKANTNKEQEALASFLNTSTAKLKSIENVFNIPTFSFGNEEYSITDDEKLIHNAVEDSLEYLFDGLTVEEFCEKIIPYLSGNIDDYLSVFTDDMTATEQFENGMFNGVWGYKFQGRVDFDKMATDVIDKFGAGHELSSYDNRTDEIDYNGSKYYIFRQN